MKPSEKELSRAIRFIMGEGRGGGHDLKQRISFGVGSMPWRREPVYMHAVVVVTLANVNLCL